MHKFLSEISDAVLIVVLLSSSLTLQMFIACRGIPVLVGFLEADYAKYRFVLNLDYVYITSSGECYDSGIHNLVKLLIYSDMEPHRVRIWVQGIRFRRFPWFQNDLIGRTTSPSHMLILYSLILDSHLSSCNLVLNFWEFSVSPFMI